MPRASPAISTSCRSATEPCKSWTTNPASRADKPIGQLMIYVLALTRLAGLRLFDIKCAWFDEEEYCEFFPRTALGEARPSA